MNTTVVTSAAGRSHHTTRTPSSLVESDADQVFLQHYTFYDFIVNKARGKSGPLFNFDVHDDVRLLADATKEKDESHAGKVVERGWYQRNKHIFPASRWEVCSSISFDSLSRSKHCFQVFDPEKNYGQYTIH